MNGERKLKMDSIKTITTDELEKKLKTEKIAYSWMFGKMKKWKRA